MWIILVLGGLLVCMLIGLCIGYHVGVKEGSTRNLEIIDDLHRSVDLACKSCCGNCKD